MAATIIGPGNMVAVNIMNPTNDTIIYKARKAHWQAVDLGEEWETVEHFDVGNTNPDNNVATSGDPDYSNYLCDLYVRTCENLNVEE